MQTTSPRGTAPGLSLLDTRYSSPHAGPSRLRLAPRMPDRNNHPWLGILLAAALALPGVLRAEPDAPFSIVSMTLHHEALAGAHDVQLDGSIAFVPGKGHSLSIIDISNPEKPDILWFKSDEEIPDAETVLPVGDHLLLGTLDFLTLDVKDPRNPVILKKISDRPTIDRINGIIMIENLAIAANKSGYVDVFDVGDMANPAFCGALETSEQFDLRQPHDIDRYRDHIVIVDPAGFEPPVGRLGMIRVMASGRLLPVDQWSLAGRVAASELIGANRVQVTGNFAIVGGSYSIRGRADAQGESEDLVTARMTVVDLSHPGNPTVVASLPFPDTRGPNGLTLAGKVAFCAGGQTVAAYDISDPGKPVLLASQSFPRYEDAEKTDNYHDLIYRDGYLYVSAQTDNGFLILRVADDRILELANSNE